jgi:hypothetical protein
MITIRDDAIEMLDQERAQAFHLREPLPRRAFSHPSRNVSTSRGVL